MINFAKIAGLVIVGIVVGLVIAGLTTQNNVGGIYNNVTNEFYSGVRVGTNPKTLKEVGTCQLIGTDASQPASSTRPYDCIVANAQSGDFVMAELSRGTTLTSLGWSVIGAQASTTNGYITVLIANQTGGARTPSTDAVGSSTPYFVISSR